MTAHAAARMQPPTAALVFWGIAGHRRALALALGTILENKPNKPSAISRGAFLEQMERHFYYDPSTRMKDALGRLLRDRGAKATSPETLHWILLTFFYIYQAHLGPEVRTAVNKVLYKEPLFRSYERELRKAGFPPLVELTDFESKTTSYGGGTSPEPPVVVKEGLPDVPPLEKVLRLLNVRSAMHALANEFFFELRPGTLAGYERAYYVIITVPPGAERPRLSLRVLRSGTASDAALIYTHYQRDRRGAQVTSNGIMCPSLNGYTLFGGFAAGEGMETIFISQREQRRDKIRGEISSLDSAGLAFRGDALAIRFTEIVWDDQDFFAKQDLAGCSTLAANVNERDLLLTSTPV